MRGKFTYAVFALLVCIVPAHAIEHQYPQSFLVELQRNIESHWRSLADFQTRKLQHGRIRFIRSADGRIDKVVVKAMGSANAERAAMKSLEQAVKDVGFSSDRVNTQISIEVEFGLNAKIVAPAIIESEQGDRIAMAPEKGADDFLIQPIEPPPEFGAWLSKARSATTLDDAISYVDNAIEITCKAEHFEPLELSARVTKAMILYQFGHHDDGKRECLFACSNNPNRALSVLSLMHTFARAGEAAKNMPEASIANMMRDRIEVKKIFITAARKSGWETGQDTIYPELNDLMRFYVFVGDLENAKHVAMQNPKLADAFREIGKAENKSRINW